MFVTATSVYQIEGAWNDTGKLWYMIHLLTVIGLSPGSSAPLHTNNT